MSAFPRLCPLIVFLSFAGCSGDSPPSQTVSKVSDTEVAAIKALQAAGATVKTDEGGSVTDIDLHKLTLTPETLDFLPDFVSLRVLNLADSSFNDQSLPVLERVSPMLVQLDLRGCQISDQATVVIARFIGLRALRLNGKNGNTNISDERLADRFGLGVVATATVGVVYNDDVANNVIVYLREVSHSHHHPNDYYSRTTSAASTRPPTTTSALSLIHIPSPRD